MQATMEKLSTALANVRERMEPELRRSVEAGLSMTSESDEPPCPTCKGAGFLRLDRPVGDPEFAKLIPCPACGAQRQQAHQARMVERISSDCGLSEAQRRLSFQGFVQYPGNEKALAAAREFAERGLAARQWLVIAGGTGRGKTHLLAAIANGAIGRGIPTVYAYVPDLLEHWRRGYRKEEGEESEAYGDFEERFERVKRVGLLLLDDLGAERRSPWVVEKLEALIDYRYREQLALVVTTNEKPESVMGLSERIYSRLERYEPSCIAVMRSLSWREYRRQRKAQGEEIPF